MSRLANRSARERSFKVLPGQYFDQETNTHYNYFRDYDPAIGRYVQADPLGTLTTSVRTSTTQLNHLYAYVNSNPLGLTDPDGLEPSPILEILTGRMTPSTTFGGFPRREELPPGITPEMVCKQSCFARLLKGTVIEELGIHGVGEVISVVKRVAPVLTAAGIIAGGFEYRKCLEDCEKKNICAR